MTPEKNICVLLYHKTRSSINVNIRSEYGRESPDYRNIVGWKYQVKETVVCCSVRKLTNPSISWLLGMFFKDSYKVLRPLHVKRLVHSALNYPQCETFFISNCTFIQIVQVLQSNVIHSLRCVAFVTEMLQFDPRWQWVLQSCVFYRWVYFPHHKEDEQA